MGPGDLRRFLAPLEGRVRSMLARAVIGTVDDERAVQELQVEALADETHDGVERFGEYGFTSVPHAEAEAMLIFPGGTRGHAVAIAIEDRRYRLKGLATGEVAIYDDLGQKVLLGRDRISIESPAEVKVIAPKVIVESDDVCLGGEGGPAVARVGDDVDLGTGKIVSGSGKVSAT